MNKRILLSIIAAALMIFNGCIDKSTDKSTSITHKENVSITNKGSHFEVILNFKDSFSHRAIGEEYGVKILQAVPDYEFLFDSYLAEITQSDSVYNTFISRVNDIKPQVNKDYCDEIDGIASKLSGLDQNIRGDGKLSTDEMYMLNLLPDVARLAQCSALSVFGQRSQTQKNISARILDWHGGSQNQITKVQSVVTFKNKSKSICTIGYLGYMGCISGLNDDKVFGAILDSSTGKTYSSASKYSYPLDLRYALENYETIDEVANYIKSPDRQYTFSHLIFLCNPSTGKVLENNISSGENCIREVRTEQSELNGNIVWDISGSIGCVNSFLLKGNLDNHSSSISNTSRFASIKSELLSKGDSVTLDELRTIASFHKGKKPGEQTAGDLYNTRTQQIIIFEPNKLNLEVFFRPKDGNLPHVPTFEKIPIAFQ